MRPGELTGPLNSPGKVNKPKTIQRDRLHVSISLLFSKEKQKLQNSFCRTCCSMIDIVIPQVIHLLLVPMLYFVVL